MLRHIARWLVEIYRDAFPEAFVRTLLLKPKPDPAGLPNTRGFPLYNAAPPESSATRIKVACQIPRCPASLPHGIAHTVRNRRKGFTDPSSWIPVIGNSHF